MAELTTSLIDVRPAAFDRLTDRLRAQGFRHPEASAIALTARGDTGLTFELFCDERRIIPDLWRQAEEGWLAREAVERLLSTNAPSLC